jgi:AmmeMemoRadiSam system protein A
MSSLASAEKLAVLEIARHVLISAVEQRDPPRNFAECEFAQRAAGAFVTLRRRGRLRGCIGQMTSSDSLLQVVTHCTKAAALQDPRFEPVRAEELPEIEIEISVLSPAAEIAADQIEIGRHGLIVTRGRQRGVLLPQVAAEFRWSPEIFLEETCAKAGLERDAWRHPETRMEAFTAEVFSESEFRLQPGAPAK